MPQGYFEYNFNRPRQSFDYLAPRVYIDKEVTKIRSLVLPVVSQYKGQATSGKSEF